MWTLLAIACLVPLVAWYWSRRNIMQTWSRQGLQGPPPNILLGNMFDYFLEGNPTLAQNKWMKVYRNEWLQGPSGCGNTIGCFVGAVPTLITSDMDLYGMLIGPETSEGGAFADRQRILTTGCPFPEGKFLLTTVFSTRQRWPTLRKIINKTYTMPNFKKGTQLISGACKTMQDRLSVASKTGEDVDLLDVLSACETDVICRCALGMEFTHLQIQEGRGSAGSKDKVHPVLRACRNLTHISVFNPFIIVAMFLPEAGPILWPLYRFFFWLMGSIFDPVFWRPFTYLHDIVMNVVDNRDENQKTNPQKGKSKDIIQMLMDARLPDRRRYGTGNLDGMTTEEVASQATAVYLGGYDIISFLMGSMGHYIINDPDLQERLRAEVNQLIEKYGESTAEKEDGWDRYIMTGLPLLRSVMNEALRLHNPVPQGFSRVAVRDYIYRPLASKGYQRPELFIPKGTTILLSSDAIARDPAYWQDPGKFWPERFLPKTAKQTSNDDVVTSVSNSSTKTDMSSSVYAQNGGKIEPFVAFGGGARVCGGMSFAYLNTLILWARVLRDFRLHPTPATAKTPTMAPHYFANQPEGVIARVEMIR